MHYSSAEILKKGKLDVVKDYVNARNAQSGLHFTSFLARFLFNFLRQKNSVTAILLLFCFSFRPSHEKLLIFAQ